MGSSIDRRLRYAAVASAFAVLTSPACAAPTAPDGEVPQPAGLWQGHMHGDTPAAVAGAKVIDDAALTTLKSRDPVLIDVAHPDSPADHGSSDRPHMSIPGATWMPGAGSGSADPQFEALFARRLSELTGGDKNRPVVAFCHPRRWGSWNAAKRAVLLGYRHVYWLPTGADGWRATHKPAYVWEDPEWKAAFAKVRDRAPSQP